MAISVLLIFDNFGKIWQPKREMPEKKAVAAMERNEEVHLPPSLTFSILFSYKSTGGVQRFKLVAQGRIIRILISFNIELRRKIVGITWASSLIYVCAFAGSLALRKCLHIPGLVYSKSGLLRGR